LVLLVEIIKVKKSAFVMKLVKNSAALYNNYRALLRSIGKIVLIDGFFWFLALFAVIAVDNSSLLHWFWGCDARMSWMVSIYM